MVKRIKTFLFTRAGALTSGAAGTGAAIHFCHHPCTSHAIFAVVAWGLSLGLALRNRIVS